MAQIEHKNSKVLVTGVTDYIGAHVAQQLLLNGYKIRGTVRDASNEERMQKLRHQITDGLPDNLPELEFVEADLLKDDTWPPAIAGCQYVCHVASPFPLMVPTNPDDIIKPAVEGTLSVLRAASADGNVKRVVLTSSVAAIRDIKTYDPKLDAEKVYNEDDWVDPEQVEPYIASKILAERAAHKFIKDLPDVEGKKKLELVAINPTYVLGPLLTDQVSTSVLGIKRLLDRSAPAVPKFHIPICDVRDVALAHVKALESQEHVGKRYLILTEAKWMKDVARIVQKEFKPLGYYVPSMIVPSTIVWLGSFFDKSTTMLVPRLDKEFKLDNRRMVEELKVTPTDIEKTIIDTAHSLIEKGVIKPSRKYKKAKQSTTGDEATQSDSNAQSGGDTTQQPNVVKTES